MKILMETTYYHPHVSGLTLYFQRLAEGLVRRGHRVTLLTARHDPRCAPREIILGVEVVRTPVCFRLNKGVFLPQLLWDAWPYLKEAEVVHLNLPAVEALDLAVAAKILGKPVVSTYVCDLTLPRFPLSSFLDRLIDLNHLLTLKLSDRVATFTQDFARHSRVLRRVGGSLVEIYPPVVTNGVVKKKGENLQLWGLRSGKGPIVGMAARWAADKGIEYLLGAIPQLAEEFPYLKVVLAGNPRAVGEERYQGKIVRLVRQFKDRVIVLGQLNPLEMTKFYRAIDVLVVASVNSTEAFGIVQVEAMMEGTPVVATNLPGVRVPIQLTRMGELARVADSQDLAEKITRVLRHPLRYRQSPEKIWSLFNPERSIKQYLKLYKEVLHD